MKLQRKNTGEDTCVSWLRQYNFLDIGNILHGLLAKLSFTSAFASIFLLKETFLIGLFYKSFRAAKDALRLGHHRNKKPLLEAQAFLAVVFISMVLDGNIKKTSRGMPFLFRERIVYVLDALSSVSSCTYYTIQL